MNKVVTAAEVQIVSPYLMATEAAAYLRTTVQGIYALVKRGRLKPMPGSGRLLFTREALDECLQRKTKRR
jgi:excisionase family DNA binding protein